MVQLANVPLPMGRVFLTSIRFWQQSTFRKVQLLALLGIIWSASPYFLLAEINTHNPFLLVSKALEFSGFSMLYLLVLLVFFAAVYYRTKQVLAGQTSGAINALGIGVRRLAALVPAVMISAVALTAGYAAIFIPGVILSVILLFYYPLVVIDNLGPFAAFKRSCELVWPHWWRTAFIVGLPLLMLLGAMIIIDIFATELWVLEHPAGGEIWALRHILRFLLGALYFPWFATLVLVQLNDLKLRQQQHVEI